jgi:hypothetical protein
MGVEPQLATGNPLTSTPENEHNITGNLTDISRISSHFPENVKQLTPIENLDLLTYHDKSYLNTVISKASRGDTFFPETIERYSKLNIPNNRENNNNYKINEEEDDDLTPLFKKLPKNNIGLTIDLNESTPLNDKIQSDIAERRPQIKFPKSSRNIFNPGFNLNFNVNSKDSNNAVKNAFNIFDKSNNNSFASGASSINSKSFQRTRKRLRSSADSINDYSDILHNSSNHKILSNINKSITGIHDNISFNNNNNNNQLQSQINSKREWLHSILSDEQCMSNITLIIQILLNTLMFLIFFGFSIIAFLAIKRDVDRKVTSYINDAIHKINSCKREYLRNNCAPEMRAPALEYKCNEWDTCMEQDPESVITSMAYFEVLADCMNAFFHNISLKSLIGIGCTLLFCIIVPNILFSKFRSTTINQNYYTNNDNDHSIPSSPLRISKSSNGTLNTPINDNFNNKGSNRQILDNPSGVRFNPNVSYSFYEYEDNGQTSKKLNNFENYQLNDLEDDENFEGNQRILLE